MHKGSGIRIGIQTAFSTPTMRPFEYAIANGFSAFEWFPDKKADGRGWDADELDADARSYIKNTARTFDIVMSVHSPWWADPLTPGGLEIILENVSFASDIGASLLNIHLYAEEGAEAYLNAITPVIHLTEETGIRLSIENTSLTGPGDFNKLFRLIKESKEVPAAHVGMCLDLGHANLHEATRNEFLKYYDLIEPAVPLIHLHLHENRGDGDSHLPLFTGPSGDDPSGVEEFLRRIVRRGYSGSAILEQWPEPPSLLNQARDRLYHMLHTMEEEPEREPSRKIKEAEPRERAVEFPDVIVRKDREASNWKDKLAWVQDLLASESFEPSRENLVYLAVYLRFLGTGKIAFSEDGGHYRPSRHAKTARAIEERLREITTPDNSFIIRKIYPWLPSYDAAFTRQEPLTRIRDIAHRNDIPGELKREIKHTLQNKLHRSADPGDLRTSEAILKRISSPEAGYPDSFVKEFRKFHKELREFFNARSLDERLRGLMKTRGRRETALLGRFLKSKKIAEEDSGRLHETLAILTELRKSLIKGMDAASGPELQRLRLSDIGLEDYAFVLLSRAINLFDEQSAGELDWTRALDVLTLAVDNFCLNETEQQECPAIINELNAVQDAFDPSETEHLLRFKASLQRCLRLSDRYTDRVLSLFPPRVEGLGRRLGVSEEAIRFFCEGDIRGNLIFQLSKLASTLLRHVRTLAGLSPWDSLVAGTASGLVVTARELGQLAEKASQNGRYIVLLQMAEGDEDIPGEAAGIVLGHAIAHLSHLGVRARRQGTVFAACEDVDTFDGLKRLEGGNAELVVTADGVRLEAADGRGESAAPLGQKTVEAPEADLTTVRGLLPISEATLSKAGSKAYAMRRLSELSASLKGKRAEFYCPFSIVIPFGALQGSISADREAEKEYFFLLELLEGFSPDNLAGTLQSLRALTGQLKMPAEILEGVKERFPPGSRLMVRSSSNCEDLPDFSGAGLYDSVANVAPEEVEDAVRKVWASLWTERAFLGRKRAGISHTSAHMAVLLQEMLVPEVSFFVHTVNPISRDRDEIYMELAVGLGETLATGIARGTPYRFACKKSSGRIRTISFASIETALFPDAAGGIASITVDYSKIPLTAEPEARRRLLGRLAAVAAGVEKEFGGPQDIEGAVSKDKIYLFQSRPEQGVDENVCE